MKQAKYEQEYQILKRLAECRTAYKDPLTDDERDLLLENTMLAIQELLWIREVEF